MEEQVARALCAQTAFLLTRQQNLLGRLGAAAAPRNNKEQHCCNCTRDLNQCSATGAEGNLVVGGSLILSMSSVHYNLPTKYDFWLHTLL